MVRPRKPEPPLIDKQPGRLVESPDQGETPAERDVEQANDALQSGDGPDQDVAGKRSGEKTKQKGDHR